MSASFENGVQKYVRGYAVVEPRSLLTTKVLHTPPASIADFSAAVLVGAI